MRVRVRNKSPRVPGLKYASIDFFSVSLDSLWPTFPLAAAASAFFFV